MNAPSGPDVASATISARSKPVRSRATRAPARGVPSCAVDAPDRSRPSRSGLPALRSSTCAALTGTSMPLCVRPPVSQRAGSRPAASHTTTPSPVSHRRSWSHGARWMQRLTDLQRRPGFEPRGVGHVVQADGGRRRRRRLASRTSGRPAPRPSRAEPPRQGRRRRRRPACASIVPVGAPEQPCAAQRRLRDHVDGDLAFGGRERAVALRRPAGPRARRACVAPRRTRRSLPPPGRSRRRPREAPLARGTRRAHLARRSARVPTRSSSRLPSALPDSFERDSGRSAAAEVMPSSSVEATTSTVLHSSSSERMSLSGFEAKRHGFEREVDREIDAARRRRAPLPLTSTCATYRPVGTARRRQNLPASSATARARSRPRARAPCHRRRRPRVSSTRAARATRRSGQSQTLRARQSRRRRARAPQPPPGRRSPFRSRPAFLGACDVCVDARDPPQLETRRPARRR